PGSAAYHPLWAPLVIFEIFGNLAFVVMAATLLFLFFTKSPRFPRLFIAYILFNAVFVTADYFFGDLIPAIAGQKTDALKEVLRTAVTAVIWVPYMLVSKRVKNTFVARERPSSGSIAEPG